MRQPRMLLVWTAVAMALTGGVDRKAARLNRTGNQEYENKEYEKAVSSYDEAQARAPESAEISYNLGNALARQGQYEAAVPHLKRAAETGPAELRPSSLHNLGNALHEMGKLPESLAAYKQALKLVPHDRDTKINYEKTLRELQKQQQQQQEQENQQGKDEQKQEKSQNQDAQSHEGSQGEQQQQEQPQESKPGEQQEQESQQSPEQESQAAEVDTSAVGEGELRPEEAMRILQAMREQEKEQQKERARQVRARARRVDKDW